MAKQMYETLPLNAPVNQKAWKRLDIRLFQEAWAREMGEHQELKGRYRTLARVFQQVYCNPERCPEGWNNCRGQELKGIKRFELREINGFEKRIEYSVGCCYYFNLIQAAKARGVFLW